ncbi:hypothetical protein [Streptomyces sp. NPDC008150]|uniref:hypothetical protein n=1 Tax=Streptomyces sp. NPDC008150 TaxID=3364816 RepID=UPI0036E48EE3
MERMRDALTRYRRVLGVLWWAATVGALTTVLPGESGVSGVGPVVGMLVAVLLAHRQERRALGVTAGELAALERRLRTGEAPTDPQHRRAMRELVDGRLTRTAHWKPALVVLVLCTAGATVPAALVAGPWWALGYALFAGACLGVFAVASSRARGGLLRMRDLLAKAPPDVPPPGPVPPLPRTPVDPRHP